MHNNVFALQQERKPRQRFLRVRQGCWFLSFQLHTTTPPPCCSALGGQTKRRMFCQKSNENQYKRDPTTNHLAKGSHAAFTHSPVSSPSSGLSFLRHIGAAGLLPQSCPWAVRLHLLSGQQVHSTIGHHYYYLFKEESVNTKFSKFFSPCYRLQALMYANVRLKAQIIPKLMNFLQYKTKKSTLLLRTV